MKTILHLIETSVLGGAEKMLITLADKLDKDRYESIICLHEDGWLNAESKRLGFETIVMPQTRTVDLRWLSRLVRMMKRRNVNLIHAHEYAMNVYGSMASAITGVPIITTVHGKNYYWEKWRRRMAYRLVSRYSTMTAVSEDIKQFLIEKVGIRSDRVATIYNGVDTEAYYQDERKRSLMREEMGIGPSQSVIGTVGSLFPVKGHTYFLKAASIVLKTFEDAIFMIAGIGECLDQLQSEARQLGIENSVMFLGLREDIFELLQGMDIFVLPSLSEGVSLSLLEAMACAKPVLASNVGGNPEVVIDGETGYLYSSGDSEALAEKIILLLENGGLADKVGRAGSIRVREEFSIESTWTKYHELYDRCFAV